MPFDVPVAVLDANVLYADRPRGLLLFMAVRGLFVPIWSEEIWREARRNLLGNGAMTLDQARYLEGRLRAAFPEAWKERRRGRGIAFALPDEGDRHVVDLAIHYEADPIVTENIRHFPAERLAAYAVKVSTISDFILGRALEAGGHEFMAAAEEHRLSLVRRPLSPGEYLSALAAHPALAETARILELLGFPEIARPAVAGGAE